MKSLKEELKINNLASKRSTSMKGDVLRLASGTGIAQLITILAAPILTRLFPPEAYGLLAMFSAITMTIGIIMCLRYEMAIVLPEDDIEAANLLVVCILLSFVVTLLSVPVILYGGAPLLTLSNMSELIAYLWLMPITILISGIFTALNYWNTRTKHFTRLSIAQVASAASSTSATLAAGFNGFATGAVMVMASVGGQAIAAFVLGGQILRDNGRFIFDNTSYVGMWKCVKRYKKFPMYSTWSGLLNTASWMAPVVMLGMFFSPTIVGFYALGFRMLQIPMSLFGNAISKVFIQRAAQANNEGSLAPLVMELFDRLVMFGLFPLLLLTIIGQDLYVVVFGANWAEAGLYTQILAIWAFFWFISSPMSSLFSVLEEQGLGLKINIGLLVTRVLSLGIGGYVGDVYMALFLFAITGIIVYGYQNLIIMQKSQVAVHNVFRSLFRGLLNAVPFILLMIIVYMGFDSPMIKVAFAVVAMALYFLLLKLDVQVFSSYLPKISH